MKYTYIFLCIIGFFPNAIQAQVLSVVSGSGFNVKSGTVISADGLDIIPSTDFNITSSLFHSSATTNTTTIPHINRTYQFTPTTAAFSGVLQLNYQDVEVNSLSENNLKLVYHTGTTWVIDSNSASNALSNVVSTTLNSKTLNEVTLGIEILQTYYLDADGDGYGNPTISQNSSIQLPGYVLNNTDCDDSAATTHPGAIDICYDGIDNDCNGVIDNVGQPGGCIPIVSSLTASSCGAVVSGLNATISCTYSNGAQGFRFRVTKVDMNTNAPLSAPIIVDRSVANFSLSSVLSVAYNSKYQIEVSVKYNNVYQPFYSDPCYVTTINPVATIGPHCGTTLSSLGQWVYSNVVPQIGAYKFRVTQLNNLGATVATPQEFVSGQARFNMNQFVGVLYNTIYRVEVSLRNTDLVYLPYNVSCSITTPAYPTAQVRDAQCNGYLVTNNNAFIYADLVNGANTYRFRVFLVNANALVYDYSYDTAFNRFNLNNFPGLVAGTTYTVEVAVRVNGQTAFGPYNKQCTIITPGLARIITSDMVLEVSNVFDVLAFPNPFASNFKLNVTTNSDAILQVKIYDMLGKIIEKRTVTTDEIQTLEVGANYPSGVYNVIVSQGDVTKTLRVIKR